MGRPPSTNSQLARHGYAIAWVIGLLLMCTAVLFALMGLASTAVMILGD